MVTSVSDGRSHVGRFGWKAQHALLVDFSGDALLNEMGFTNALFPTENAPNGDLGLLAECDSVPDPEDKINMLHRVTRVMQFSALPPRKRMNAMAVQGEELFNSVGCGFCHYSGYTSVSSIPAINGQKVNVYSDFLLHDIGTGDGIVQGDAQGNEFRTAPLAATRGSHAFLHDGRARTAADAISAHQGQALAVRNAYLALSRSEQEALQEFLKR